MGKIAIISDVHANLPALEAVLKDIKKMGISEIYCLGDIVGYGANPNECVEIVRDVCSVVLLGNHDAASCGLEKAGGFNEEAEGSVLWTMDKLTQKNKDYLKGLKRQHTDDLLSVCYNHSAPGESNKGSWTYLINPLMALTYCSQFAQKTYFVGHTHLPTTFVYSLKRNDACEKDFPIEIGEDTTRAVINVGSVGQPRDGDPRAAYAVYDKEKNTVRLVRVEYDIERAIVDIIDAGLPKSSGERLTKGR